MPALKPFKGKLVQNVTDFDLIILFAVLGGFHGHKSVLAKRTWVVERTVLVKPLGGFSVPLVP
eukprot:3734804-Amphidinium_carterae.1